ncbi:MAG TPA: SDR family NAD(P)-dependent oxidoreductase [Steroidobacteraceae bacterium]|nr:SDR family NAD(P)-dependent oxidoreductase [Steroidobacteraceae bacterium]
MQIRDKVIVVTGGANGIGLALARRFKQEGAKHITIADLDGDKAQAAAKEIGGLGLKCDVSRESDIQNVVAQTEKVAGPIDLFCSNAGIAVSDPDFENAASAPDTAWEKNWRIHVMAHVYAARALLPKMIARKQGYFLNTVSAAGLLSQIGSGTYSASKHAAIGFAEHLAITHKDHGIKVSVLCPQAVRTAMLGDSENDAGKSAAVDGVLTPEQVADAVIQGLQNETFVILPHAQVLGYMQKKTADYNRWIGGMVKLRRTMLPNMHRFTTK